MREQAYLRGIWTDLIPQETTPFYQRFVVESCQRGTCVGEVDSRQLYPDVYQIGISEVSWVLFLGLCLDFHYFLGRVAAPKLGFYFSRRPVAQALVGP